MDSHPYARVDRAARRVHRVSGPAAVERRPLWTCPRCGHTFVTANIWHSCTLISLDDAFAQSTPLVRASFECYVELIASCGPVTVIAQKHRIAIMGRVRFAGVVVRRDKLIASFALTRRLDDARLRVEVYNERWIAHRFEVRRRSISTSPG